MDIKGITNLPEPQDSGRVKNTPSKKNDKSSYAGKETDNVSISSEAQKASKEIGYINKMKELPDIRPELVEKAKADIISGELLSEKNVEATAEKLLKGFVNNPEWCFFILSDECYSGIQIF